MLTRSRYGPSVRQGAQLDTVRNLRLDTVSQLRAANPGMAVTEIAKALGALWRSLSDEEREVRESSCAGPLSTFRGGLRTGDERPLARGPTCRHVSSSATFCGAADSAATGAPRRVRRAHVFHAVTDSMRARAAGLQGTGGAGAGGAGGGRPGARARQGG